MVGGGASDIVEKRYDSPILNNDEYIYHNYPDAPLEEIMLSGNIASNIAHLDNETNSVDGLSLFESNYFDGLALSDHPITTSDGQEEDLYMDGVLHAHNDTHYTLKFDSPTKVHHWTAIA